jgi:triacylglycerol lipase
MCADLAETPRRTHFIGHSLGGLICRAGLMEPVGFPLGRLVMIASPNRGVRIVQRLQKLPLLSGLPRLFGKPALELGRDAAWFGQLGLPPVEIGVIAGTRGFHPLNPSSWLNTLVGNEGRHDGTVELDSAMLPGMQDFMSVDLAHTFICDDDRVIAATLNFLKQGSFAIQPY